MACDGYVCVVEKGRQLEGNQAPAAVGRIVVVVLRGCFVQPFLSLCLSMRRAMVVLRDA